MNQTRIIRPSKHKGELNATYTAGTKQIDSPDENVVVAQITYITENGVSTANIKQNIARDTACDDGEARPLVIDLDNAKKTDVGSSLFQAISDSTSPEYLKPGKVQYTDSSSSDKASQSTHPGSRKCSKSKSRSPISKEESWLNHSSAEKETKEALEAEIARYSAESKQWDRLISDYKSQAANSQKFLKDVQRGDDPRLTLHGPRRSRYTAPPTFAFSCQDIVKEMEDLTARGEIAVEIIKRQEKKIGMLTSPSETNSLKDISRMQMRRISCGASTTISPLEKSARVILAKVAKTRENP